MIAGEPEVRVYKEISGESLTVHIFKPDVQETLLPAIVWYYGSGFNQKPPGQFPEHGKLLSELGMVSIPTNIRGAIREGGNRDFRVCIEDAKSAFRWVRAHAKELNIDPTRIAVGGGSSGGFLATAIAALPAFDAPTDDFRIPLNPSLQILFNPGVGGDDKLYSPLKNVQKGIAPAIIFHGTEDTTIPLSQMYEYKKAIANVGGDC